MIIRPNVFQGTGEQHDPALYQEAKREMERCKAEAEDFQSRMLVRLTLFCIRGYVVALFYWLILMTAMCTGVNYPPG